VVVVDLPTACTEKLIYGKTSLVFPFSFLGITAGGLIGRGRNRALHAGGGLSELCQIGLP
jgi:hypothetical protein